MAILELNEVLLEGASRTVSLIAQTGQLMCVAGGKASERTRLLKAVLGLVPLKEGIISIDGTPLTRHSAPTLRRQMAYAPCQLQAVGNFPRYEVPSVQEVFALKANRQADISNGILAEEMKRTGCEGTAAQLLAVAALLERPLVVCDEPPVASTAYLRALAQKGRIVVAASLSQTLQAEADLTIEI